MRCSRGPLRNMSARSDNLRMEIAVNIKPLQLPTDPHNEVIAAALQARSKQMVATVPSHYLPLQGIAFRKCNLACRGTLKAGR